MQCFTLGNIRLLGIENLSIGRILLATSMIIFTQLSQVEAAPLRAVPCTLAWNQSQGPVSGYRLYFGIKNSAATNRLDVGMTNLIILNTLLASSNYFFYVVAYNVCGIESPPSAVMSYAPQTLSSLRFIPLANGISGLHFLAATGAVCHVEYTSNLNPPQWQTLSNATADACGNVTLTDPLSGNPPARFYRSVVP
jgi:hypothetical protein